MEPTNAQSQPPVVASQPPAQNKDLVKDFPKRKFSKSSLTMAVVAFLVVLAGVGTGWLLSGSMKAKSDTAPEVSSEAKNEATEAGVADESTFRDSAEGTLVVGGIKGEGTHHLDRNLGEDKYVYLTSTVIDLDKFTGKKVQVWGETIKGKNAGWLMDVGKIKVIK
ncbi:hypothetical protein A3A76_01605 [Candidatus Woesebacteria bacterium RIFCSPLOWO2_01_FULL_39_23]|uniref:Uncharacterized protein n=1 Tax=Candidatus Woesebacteria bacterium RIFCSPHIGHO2_01_FULL_40_22 TaxID=1802499 RepID=A0A1F7YI10_9BACT|nr:MAG: hypothetical protein A2141_04765 [Candidatus Woesebacteria bacterium RBG_16_40_11]OGM26519.1 MAG: hypothetical protein A2628_03200 [Candidatus Woesebacteria bacterium RIFCSPHIGHO2_01_FULL_40_22]OGM37683.1 MAG: hypothetical protein A3E41_05720 [Candidatus Woesebacteria bacterium RIFCSPHIGHO2_12_FULL_38_9]OGM62971.1 MAG: hypothetical protein A3A76_01605 [Candidatus Woesebacteria bacterium RIFCSPLOWO2_01_FULL_39_23]